MDYKNILKDINAINMKDYSALIDLCKRIEVDIDASLRTASNEVRTMTLEAFKRNITSIIKAVTLCKYDRNILNQQDLKDEITMFICALQTTIVLIELLEEDGSTEEKFDEHMSAHMLKF